MTKSVYKSKEKGGRDRCRPCTRWLDGVKMPWSARSQELRDEKKMLMDRVQCRDFVKVQPCWAV